MDIGALRNTSNRLLQHFLDVVFPPGCAVCQSRGTVLCQSCLAGMQPLRPPYCQRCNTPPGSGVLCKSCRYTPLALSGLRVFSKYEGPLRQCIHELKYAGNRRLAEPLGRLLAQTYAYHGLQADVIVPVPLHSERLKQRGYNQAQLLAQVCTSYTRVALDTSLVMRVRSTTAQVELSMSKRQQNVAGAFCCSPMVKRGGLRGRRILLIDDVCTTGATLGACAAPLFAAGAQAVWGLVLARPMHESFF